MSQLFTKGLERQLQPQFIERTEYSDLTSLMIDGFDLLVLQGTLKSLL